jgi:hypothetical protein
VAYILASVSSMTCSSTAKLTVPLRLAIYTGAIWPLKRGFGLCPRGTLVALHGQSAYLVT